MRRFAATTLAALALAASACGGDGGESAARESGSGPAEGAIYDITVGEFIAELQPDKQRVLEALVAESDACAGVEVEPSFVLLITSQGLDADQGSPLADLVEAQC